MLPKDWYNYKTHYAAHDRLQGSKRGARRREKQIARMQDDESRGRGGGGCFGVLVVLVMSIITMGLLSCARDIVVDRGVVVEKIHTPSTSGTGWVNGHIVVTQTDAIHRLVVRIGDRVYEVPVYMEWYWQLEVGDTVAVHRYDGSWNWKMVPPDGQGQ